MTSEWSAAVTQGWAGIGRLYRSMRAMEINLGYKFVIGECRATASRSLESDGSEMIGIVAFQGVSS